MEMGGEVPPRERHDRVVVGGIAPLAQPVGGVRPVSFAATNAAGEFTRPPLVHFGAL